MAKQEGTMENMVNRRSLEQFYNGKKVLITGHTGFKGAWLSSWLIQLGAKVKGYALQPEYETGIFEALVDGNRIETVFADIRDRELLVKHVDDFQPDIVFHLAAQPLVRRSYEIPVETFETNVIGTANLLEAVRKLPGQCATIVVTTDKVYRNIEKPVLYNETDRLGGYDPYSASKACTELVVDAYRNSFFNYEHYSVHLKSVATARAGNVIGGGDWSRDRIIPDIVRALSAGETISIRNAASVRPWQHVLEPLGGYLLLAMSLYSSPNHFAEAFNFGPHENGHVTVKQLVEAAISAWGYGEWKQTGQEQQVHEAGLLKLDINKSINSLHWKPKLDFSQTIDWTVRWYAKPAPDRFNFTLEQINEYMEL